MREVVTPLPDADSALQWKQEPPPRVLEDGIVHVWRARLSDYDGEEHRLQSLLTPEELARADRYRFPVPRRRFVIGRAVLRSLLGDYLHLPQSEIELTVNEHGKPYLASASEAWLQFNLAHSGDLLLCAFCRKSPIGIDVEAVRPLDAMPFLGRTFLSAAERRLLDTLPSAGRQRALLTACVCKEAYGKGVGSGIGEVQSLVLLTPETIRSLLDVEDAWIATCGSKWQLYRFEPDSGYIAAFAVMNPVRAVIGCDVGSSFP
jgi:4'-phosphopantetheinyl transferase